MIKPQVFNLEAQLALHCLFFDNFNIAMIFLGN